MKKVFAFLFVLWGCCICVWSQGGLFFTSDKLSNTNITSICQDKSGYIWIGTENGLNRFDGYKFTAYKNNPQDSTSLMFNIVNKVFCDKQGNLWVGTNTGLQRYDDTTDSFVKYNSTVFERARQGVDRYRLSGRCLHLLLTRSFLYSPLRLVQVKSST